MLKHTALTLSRISQLSQRIRDKIYSEKISLFAEMAGPVSRITFHEATSLQFRPVPIGSSLEPYGSTFWFRVTGRVPSSWTGRRVDFLWISHSEATLWRDGEPIQGLNFEPANSTCLRPEVKLWDKAPDDQNILLHVEVACNQLNAYNWRRVPTYKTLSPFVFEEASLGLFDPEAWELYHDYLLLSDLLSKTSPTASDPWGGVLMSELNYFVNEFRLEDRSTWKSAHQRLKRVLANRNATIQHELSAIGHGHIDTAWLWPIEETKRKCLRTFTTALAYFEDYPEYKFTVSQAQQYAWVKDDYPSTYKRIKESVNTGNWIPSGGTWIEPDCNLPSGESLVRQFLYGQRFFEKEFGKRCVVFWNPDVFGYSGALPQIIRKSGIEFFLTQKLSWNQFTKPLHHTFEWEGIDGSCVLTHFPPGDTYNAMWDEGGFPLKDILHSVSNFKDHERSCESLLVFGYGDGGGGPTRGMLEVLRRIEDLQGVPRTAIRSPAEFFERLKEKTQDMPRCVGELYFEYHRGTYTTQAAIKKANRTCELLLREVEILSVLSKASTNTPYPGAEIERLWKLVLLNQFHDIIPGSSILEVNAKSREQYAEVESLGRAIKDGALNDLLDNTFKDKTLFNPCSWARTSLADLGEGDLQFVFSPGLGLSALSLPQREWEPVKILETDETLILENEFLQATFSKSGSLVHLLDKENGKRIVTSSPVRGNQFVVYEDWPHDFDAWEVDAPHLETREEIPGALNFTIISENPARVEIEFLFRFGRSSIRERVIVEAHERILKFNCDVDWNETHRFLKVEFPVNVRATEAAFEIQFGFVRRPTHFNTIPDIARFEVCAHKWMDLSQPDYGVALLNDSKYGCAVHGSTLRLSLLRSPTFPDPEADQGQHSFSFALFPHAGDFISAGVVRKAFEFNCPLSIATGAPRINGPIFYTDSEHLVIDTIKQAEDGSGVIVRLYEAHGTSGSARFGSSLEFSECQMVNLLEDDTNRPLSWKASETRVEYGPFEIISLKFF